ncbi:GspH/FimT family pseudopilin [Rhodanobacter sp. L36]|uniref:GspH/FimT family pseudopilin n=1 Tax=Rhodanobacter sp. L36 TaxID=1747221 RepID=UPI00131E47A8|nr:GspH/FimT family pseudopilin [Rhodanobacter sp. L36]
MRRPSRGFTLIELLVTLVVAAILVSIALPSFRDLMRRSRVSSASNTLTGNLAYARTEAIDRGQLVSMCPSTDGQTCAGGTTLETGWIVYTYPSGAASANKAATATSLILRATANIAGVSVQSKNAEIITFGQQGQLKSTAMATSGPTLDFITCYRSGSTGLGTSTATVPGAELKVNGSGSVATDVVATGTACSP